MHTKLAPALSTAASSINGRNRRECGCAQSSVICRTVVTPGCLQNVYENTNRNVVSRDNVTFHTSFIR